jgi:hypothetical protein
MREMGCFEGGCRFGWCVRSAAEDGADHRGAAGDGGYYTGWLVAARERRVGGRERFVGALERLVGVWEWFVGAEGQLVGALGGLLVAGNGLLVAGSGLLVAGSALMMSGRPWGFALCAYRSSFGP